MLWGRYSHGEQGTAASWLRRSVGILHPTSWQIICWELFDRFREASTSGMEVFWRAAIIYKREHHPREPEEWR